MIALVVVVVAVYVLHQTRFGRTVYAVGGNRQSAQLMGLNASRARVSVYAISGLCAALAGLLLAVQKLSGYSLNGIGLELDAIAAAVIGGVLLSGGVGFVLGSVIGVLVLGTIQTFVTAENLDSYWTRIMTGVLLLMFVLVQRLVVRKTRMSSHPMHPMAPKPVMADVAQLAGVSHQTVSRVINGSPSIRPATKARVEQAIEELGYRPNTAARALVTRRSGIIGIVGTNSALFGPSSIQRSVQEAARAAGYFSSLVPLAEVTVEELRGALDHLARQSVEAIVMIAAQEDALAVVHSADAGLPLIVVEGDLSGRGLSVGVDQIDGARQATQHLIDLGHRAIDHVAGPMSWTEAKGRRTGYEDGHAGRGAAPRWRPGRATGPRPAATRSAASWRNVVTRQRCSWPTTRWPSGCCTRSPRRGCGSRTTSASSDSTTSPKPATSTPR